MVNGTSLKGEIMRNAQRLVKYRGSGALRYSEMMVKRMNEDGDEHEQAYWEKISRQVELLINESG